MSPNRPDRPEAEGAASDCAEPRRRGGTEVIEVSGPSDVEARIELQLSQCRRRRSVLALLCVSVRDMQWAPGAWNLGYEREVRDEVTQRICNGVRSVDRVLRESERDACVLLPDATEATALRVAKRLERSLNGPYRVADQLVHVAVRISMAAHPEDGSRAAELLQRACERG